VDSVTSPTEGESAALERLIENIEPELREILRQGLSGVLPPSVALMQLLTQTEDAGRVRALVDEITMRAASLSRSTDSLLRDRVDELTQLSMENEQGCEKIAEMLRADVDSPEKAPTAEEGIAFCERLFDWSVQQSEEASVALYSLADPGILERSTREIVSLLELWGLVSPEKSFLDIGCGIGRVITELAPKVREAHGVDLSANMIAVARRRNAHFANVRLVKGNGRDLHDFGDGSFDTVIAVDVFPYINQSGAELVSGYFSEIRRVLRPDGSLVILNYSYRHDDNSDVSDVKENGAAHGFDIVTAGTRPFSTWDGLAFHLVRSAV
jgi:SAM-dependent methyltransferase